MSCHHAGEGGLQSHSLGDLYPWSVVIYKTVDGNGQAKLENLVTGEKLTPHGFKSDFSDFADAHAKAVGDLPRLEN